MAPGLATGLAPGSTPLADQARRGGPFVFTGSQTPHDPGTGRLVHGLRDLPDEIRAELSTGILFLDVPSDRVRAQTWRVLRNLEAALSAAGSDLARLAYLRIHLRDVTDEPTVRDVLVKVLGSDLPAGELVGATNAGVNQDIDVQCDAIALAADAGDRQNVEVPGVSALASPFAIATRAGPFLFTSMIPGIDPRTRDPLQRIDQLGEADRALAGGSGRYTRHVEPFVAQHFAMWRHFGTVLSAAGLTERSIVYYKTWVRRPMREVSHAYMTDLFAKRAGTPFCFTRFPVAALRHPGALVEGRLIAVLPGVHPAIKVAAHGVSTFYIGAIEAGDLIITAGEVPIDTAARWLIDHACDLSGQMRLMNYGRIHRESRLMAQAHHVYDLLENALAAHGGTFGDVVHQSVYLTDVSEFPALERMACLRFGQRLPPTSIVPIIGASPFAGTRVEIEVTARRREAGSAPSVPSTGSA